MKKILLFENFQQLSVSDINDFISWIDREHGESVGMDNVPGWYEEFIKYRGRLNKQKTSTYTPLSKEELGDIERELKSRGMLAESSLNEAMIPVFKDITMKDKEMVDQKDLGGYIKSKMEAAAEETNLSHRKDVLVVVQNPKYWQREFVVLELEGDNIKTVDRNKKPVVFKLKEVVAAFAE